MEATRHINDIIALNMLQYIQDNFSRASGLAFITVDYKGRQITRTSNYTAFCSNGQSNPEFKELCAQCDAHGGLHAAITGQPNIYYCHANLVDFAVPLIVDNSYLGAVLGGQAKLPDTEADKLDHITLQRSNWRQDAELSRHHDEIVTLPLSKIKATVTLLHDMIKYLIEEKYKKLLSRELYEKNQELIEEKAHRIDMHENAQENELDVINNQIGFENFFTILNLIAKLAYHENAQSTEAVVCDFSAMMRYALSNNSIVTVGEEIDYVERLLRIQKTQMAGKLNYKIIMPKEFANIACPFMLLKPIVENALKCDVGHSRRSGEIHIEARNDGDDLLFTVLDDGEGMTLNAIESILHSSGHRGNRQGKTNLHNIHRKLESYYGRGYGLQIKSVEDGISGTEVSFRIPLSESIR